MTNSDHSENLRWPFGLLCVHNHFISRYLLVVLLAQDGNDIKGGATRQSYRHQLDWLRATRSSRVVQNQVMTAAGLRNELPPAFPWFGETYFCCNHLLLIFPGYCSDHLLWLGFS